MWPRPAFVGTLAGEQIWRDEARSTFDYDASYMYVCWRCETVMHTYQYHDIAEIERLL